MNLNVPDFHLIENAVELRKLQREGLFSDPKQKYYIMSMHQTMDGLKEIGELLYPLLQMASNPETGLPIKLYYYFFCTCRCKLIK
mgnify:CR=1 FL=1